MDAAKPIATETLPALREDWRLEALAAALFGLVPVIGVTVWGWSPFALIVLFWFENLVLGVRQAAAMMITAVVKHGLLGLIAGGALTAFFCVHYGIFTFVHGVFVFALFGGGDAALAAGRDQAGLAPDDLAGALFLLNDNFLIGAAAIVVWQAVQLGWFIVRGEPARASVHALMGEPYPRLIMLHLTIIFGGMLIMALGWPPVGVILLAVLKIAGDVALIRNAAKRKAR
ncbi:MAG: DUF6498-containing protein [Hyphomonadaceae bacterium]|nr:DUF6498-containing protein [Hyphomonadaceae bacterium]